MHLQKLNEEPLKAGAVTAATFQDTSGQLCGFQRSGLSWKETQIISFQAPGGSETHFRVQERQPGDGMDRDEHQRF